MTKSLPLLGLAALAALLGGSGRHVTHAFPALAATPTESASLAKLMLRQSLLSPSGKLTLSPEIIIPEPTDPTAMLLQTSEVQQLSNTLRTKAKSNAAFIAGSIGSLRTVCTEQEGARGNFPGPVPVVYCASQGASVGWEDEVLAEVADAGACGVLLTLNGGEELADAAAAKAAASDAAFVAEYKAVLGAGLQPLPEAVLSEANADGWSEDDVEGLVAALTEGCGEEPAGLILSVASLEEEKTAEAEDDDEEEAAPEEKGIFDAAADAAARDAAEEAEKAAEDEEEVAPPLPSVSKPLSKRIPILGSVRTPAGGGRIGTNVSYLKDAGFTGAVLRCECVPGYRLNPDLDVVGGFWSAAISDLKSTRSKSFGFRAKVALGAKEDVPRMWMDYQKGVMESGALGGPEGGPEEDFDSAGGDFKGF